MYNRIVWAWIVEKTWFYEHLQRCLSMTISLIIQPNSYLAQVLIQPVILRWLIYLCTRLFWKIGKSQTLHVAFLKTQATRPEQTTPTQPGHTAYSREEDVPHNYQGKRKKVITMLQKITASTGDCQKSSLQQLAPLYLAPDKSPSDFSNFIMV